MRERQRAEIQEKVRGFIGSYKSVSAAVHKCLELSVLNGAQAVELWEYAKMVEESNKAAVQAIQKELSAIMHDKGE